VAWSGRVGGTTLAGHRATFSLGAFWAWAFIAPRLAITDIRAAAPLQLTRGWYFAFFSPHLRADLSVRAYTGVRCRLRRSLRAARTPRCGI